MTKNATRWRGRLPVPPPTPPPEPPGLGRRTHPLIRRLFVELNAQHTTISEVADRSGLRRGTISDWRYRQEPRVSDLDAVLNVLGLELAVRPRRDA